MSHTSAGQETGRCVRCGSMTYLGLAHYCTTAVNFPQARATSPNSQRPSAAASETPLTDAAQAEGWRAAERGSIIADSLNNGWDFARQLERDLAAAKAAVTPLGQVSLPDAPGEVQRPEVAPLYLLSHWELVLGTYKKELAKGRAESYAMREALLVLEDLLSGPTPPGGSNDPT